ncbi:hypothetical protein PILCRDRAFT_827719 [Piloderma croceum F 1598]|uniref:Uncharacterized protein n=1 Tax=Piloderma croceum (strain F 1598) TaxID=765440 RepID=A0A0C3F546_PILCF|nr:hypothetical protein PILCRDRAFT_827719 [Piloderma croceum F 1598]
MKHLCDVHAAATLSTRTHEAEHERGEGKICEGMRFHGLTPLEHPSLIGSRLVACASLNHQGVSATLSRGTGVSLSLLLLASSLVSPFIYHIFGSPFN